MSTISNQLFVMLKDQVSSRVLYLSITLIQPQICVDRENFNHRGHKVGTEFSEIFLGVL